LKKTIFFHRTPYLNLPQEWIVSSPWGCCAPINISGGHEDNHDNASDTSNTSNISDAYDAAKNGGNDHSCSVGGIRAVGVLVVTSIGNEDKKIVFGGQTPIDVLNHLPVAKRTQLSGGNKKRDNVNNKLLLVFPLWSRPASASSLPTESGRRATKERCDLCPRDKNEGVIFVPATNSGTKQFCSIVSRTKLFFPDNMYCMRIVTGLQLS
jgi:hypothetical protein